MNYKKTKQYSRLVKLINSSQKETKEQRTVRDLSLRVQQSIILMCLIQNEGLSDFTSFGTKLEYMNDTRLNDALSYADFTEEEIEGFEQNKDEQKVIQMVAERVEQNTDKQLRYLENLVNDINADFKKLSA